MTLRLLLTVAELANRADTLADAATSTFAEVCQERGWVAGHLCQLDDTGRSVISTGTWHLADPIRYARLQRTLEGRAVIRSIGVAADAWAGGDVVWAGDLAEPGRDRAEEAKVLGVRGACACPVISEHRIVAVVEFFSAQPLEVDDELASVLTAIANQLSRVVEREQAAHRIRENEERTRRILATARDAYIAMDAEGLVTGWNRAAEETFGWTAREAIGERLDRLIIPERFRDAHRKGLLRFLFTGDSAVMDRSLELFGLRRDGGEFPIELSIWAVREGDWSFNAFVRDISARKEAEQALRESEEALKQANHELNVRAAELERAHETLAEFASVAAHDLGGPLQVMTGYAELVATRFGSVLDEQGRGWLDQIQRAGYRGKDLIGDLLAYARVGRSQDAPTTVSLVEVARQAVAEVRELHDAAGAAVEAGVEIGELPVVVGEERQLRQLFVYLVDNALKFAGGDGRTATVTIRARTAHDPDHVGSAPSTETIVCVADDGPGIPVDAHDRVFKMFERLDGGAHDADEGRGLGLALCKRIVERHGGRIWIESPGDEPGARVCFSLPSTRPD